LAYSSTIFFSRENFIFRNSSINICSLFVYPCSLKSFTVKEAQVAFPPLPFGSNTPKACQRALKWESFPDES
jgi:hypothetical protein